MRLATSLYVADRPSGMPTSMRELALSLEATRTRPPPQMTPKGSPSDTPFPVTQQTPFEMPDDTPNEVFREPDNPSDD